MCGQQLISSGWMTDMRDGGGRKQMLWRRAEDLHEVGGELCVLCGGVSDLIDGSEVDVAAGTDGQDVSGCAIPAAAALTISQN